MKQESIIEIKQESKWKNIMLIFEWEADISNIDEIFKKIFTLNEDNDSIILNLEKLTFCNSKFIWNLFFLADTIEKKWWKICILWCNQIIYDSLKTVWMFELMKLFYNKDEAINYLNE